MLSLSKMLMRKALPEPSHKKINLADELVIFFISAVLLFVTNTTAARYNERSKTIDCLCY